MTQVGGERRALIYARKQSKANRTLDSRVPGSAQPLRGNVELKKQVPVGRSNGRSGGRDRRVPPVANCGVQRRRVPRVRGSEKPVNRSASTQLRQEPAHLPSLPYQPSDLRRTRRLPRNSISSGDRQRTRPRCTRPDSCGYWYWYWDACQQPTPRAQKAAQATELAESTIVAPAWLATKEETAANACVRRVGRGSQQERAT